VKRFSSAGLPGASREKGRRIVCVPAWMPAWQGRVVSSRLPRPGAPPPSPVAPRPWPPADSGHPVLHAPNALLRLTLGAEEDAAPDPVTLRPRAAPGSFGVASAASITEGPCVRGSG